MIALFFSTSLCAIAEAADAQPRALAAAAAVRVPMLFTGAVAAGPPPPPQCDPGEFARGEAAARVDVAEMDANPKSVPAFHPAPRENGAAGGCLRTGSTRRLVRHLTWAGNRDPGLRAGTMGREAPSGALQMGRLAAPKRQS